MNGLKMEAPPQEGGTPEDGKYTAEFAPPGGIEGVYLVDVVTLDPDSEEILDAHIDPVTRNQFKVGQRVLRVSNTPRESGEFGDVFTTYAIDSIEYLNEGSLPALHPLEE